MEVSAQEAISVAQETAMQFWDMQHVVDKARASGNDAIMVCERGATFGYNYLVSDMRSLVIIIFSDY